MQVRFGKTGWLARRKAAAAGVVFALGAGLASALAAGLADVRSEFNKALALESQGQVRGVVAVFDEISRCAKARTLPAAPAVEPVELHDVQVQFLTQIQQQQYSNEMEIVRLSGRYLQTLAQGGSSPGGSPPA
jgi:hypothetical protein